jgi:hypothetical protein
LSYQANWAAGKNKLINGDCFYNQRNFSSAVLSGTRTFAVDRWVANTGGATGTVTYSTEQFTAGTAPVSGYESKQHIRMVTTGQTATSTFTIIDQEVENVRTFANQNTTFSFWAKAASGTPKVAIEFVQNFGTGGSPSADVNTYIAQVTLSTSWTRYSVTGLVPSISGKTLGTTENTSYVSPYIWVSAGSNFNARTGSLGIQSNTFDFWGFQWEAGSVATAFQTATGTLQGELAACQRYYYRISDPAGTQLYTAITVLHDNSAQNSTTVYGVTSNPVPMRTTPTSTEFSNIAFHRNDGTLFAISAVTLDTATDSILGAMYNLTVSGVTAGNVGRVLGNNNSGAYFGVSAEF